MPGPVITAPQTQNSGPNAAPAAAPTGGFVLPAVVGAVAGAIAPTAQQPAPNANNIGLNGLIDLGISGSNAAFRSLGRGAGGSRQR